MGQARNLKSDVIRYVLEMLGVCDRKKVLMIGDREQDIKGAKENSIACAGVLYGYGNREELEQAGADYILDKPETILNLVLPADERRDRFFSKSLI